MQHLPWLLVHGMGAWWAALAASVAIALGGAWGWRRIRLVRQTQRTLAKLGMVSDTAEGFVDGATVTVSGRVRAEGARCARFEDGVGAAAATAAGSETAVTARAERLILVHPTSGEPLAELVGEVELLSGSREATKAGAAIALRSIADGDLVRARGVLRREAAAAGTTYRVALAMWTLGSEAPEEMPIACERAPRLVGRPWAQVGRVGGAAAAVFAVGSTFAGAALIDSAQFLLASSAADPERIFVLTKVAAAATPLQRKRALELSRDALARSSAQDFHEASLERAVAAAELADDPRAAAELLLVRGQLGRAAKLGERIGEHGLVARAEYLRGNFGAATLALGRAGTAGSSKDAKFEVRAQLLAGDLRAAAHAARIAAALEASAPGEPWERRQRWGLACLADALEARAKARPWVGRAEHRFAAAECAVLHADLLEGNERQLALGDIGELDVERVEEIVDLLSLEAQNQTSPAGAPAWDACVPQARELPWAEQPTRLFKDGVVRVSRAPGLERAVFDQLSTAARRCERVGSIAASAAAFAAVSGDYPEARRLALEAARALASKGNPHGGALLQAAIELYAGSIPAARAFLTAPPLGFDRYEVANLLWLADLRDGYALSKTPPGLADQNDTWDHAAKTDDVAFARWLQAGAEGGVGPELAAAVSRADRDHREVRAWLRWGARRGCWWCDGTQGAFDAARLRDAAEALGDHALAAELDATASAFRRAMLRRDISVPLAVLAVL